MKLFPKHCVSDPWVGLGWVSCATLQVAMDLARPCTQESVVGGRVPRGRPWAGHCTCWFFRTLLPRQVPVCVCVWVVLRGRAFNCGCGIRRGNFGPRAVPGAVSPPGVGFAAYLPAGICKCGRPRPRVGGRVRVCNEIFCVCFPLLISFIYLF